MSSTFTPNLNLELQGVGDNPGTWGTVLNTAALAIIDTVLGGMQTLSLSNVPVAVSTTQSQNNFIRLTGTLTGDVTVTFPAIGRTYFVANDTTGNFNVTIARSGGGATVVMPQGRNGTIVLSSLGVSTTVDNLPAGAVSAFAMSTVPTGWLECNGAAVSRSTYASLFAAIGITYGAGNGSTTFNLPDLRAYFIRGWDNGRGIDPARVFGSTQAGSNISHSHGAGTLLMPNHGHPSRISARSDSGPVQTTSGGMGIIGIGTSGYPAYTGAAGDTAGQQIGGSGTASITGSTASDGTESRPINIAMMYCIKT